VCVITSPAMALTASQRRVAGALADTLFPTPPDAPSAGTVVSETIDDLLDALPAETRKGFTSALGLFELLGVPTRLSRFSRMKPAARERYVAAWQRGGKTRRMVYRALRDTLATIYYQDPRGWQAIGYPGPQVTR